MMNIIKLVCMSTLVVLCGCNSSANYLEELRSAEDSYFENSAEEAIASLRRFEDYLTDRLQAEKENAPSSIAEVLLLCQIRQYEIFAHMNETTLKEECIGRMKKYHPKISEDEVRETIHQIEKNRINQPKWATE